MPSINPHKNREHQNTSAQRRARAYWALKLAALDAGYMQHPRDGTGFDNFMNDIESGELEIKPR